MRNNSSNSIVRRIKAGDNRAFAEIVAAYGKKVFTLVMKMVENKEDAEDISQEIFIRVFKSISQFREDAEFSTYLYRIAYNTSISELRKRKMTVLSLEDEIVEPESQEEDENAVETEIKLQFLNEALKKLQPDERFLVTLYYMEDKTMDEISLVCGLSVANVKVKMYRIRKKLEVEINKMMQNYEE
jgi:RNA polymerase sigma-70 factor (ECF subfamily)